MCAHPVVRPPLPAPFFREVTARSALDGDQRATVAAVRALLAELAPVAVRPERTNALRAPDGAVELRILHAHDDTRLTLRLRDGTTTLGWIGGRTRAPWGSDQERALAALLTGRNVLTMHLRLGHVHTIDTTVWDADGAGRRLLHRRLVHGTASVACRHLPGGGAVERMSVSFDRPEGLGPAPDDAELRPGP